MLTRRRLLSHLSRQAAALAFGNLFATGGPARAAGRVVFGREPFSLGVASGMPRPDSVLLWTRLAPDPHAPDGGMPAEAIEVTWELAEDEHFGRGVRRGSVLARIEHAHSVHVPVTGLRSGSTWFYRFIAGDAVSPVGRTRTAPAEDAAVPRLRLGLASCQHYEQGAFIAHREIAASDLDLVLFVGDYIYESSGSRDRLRLHEGPEPKTLAAYRARHATYKLDADLRAAHAAHPWLVTWDDHEVENDYANDRSQDDEPPDVFLRRRAAAYKAWFEHLPLAPEMAPRAASAQIHAQFRWGRLAELWTLDGRQYRSPQACAEAGRGGGRLSTGCAELDDPGRTIFGAAQERWLAAGLVASPRRWKLLGQASQISPSAVDGPSGRRLHTDGWDGYPQARARLLRAIAEPRVENVLCLGGDVHRHVAANLRLQPNEARSPIVASEFVATSVTSRGASQESMARLRASNPDVLHARGDERGYALVEVTPALTRCDFRATPHPAQADVSLRSQAGFVVASGRAGVQRV